MNFIKATGAAFNLAQLFINFPFKKLKKTKKDLVQKIFKEHFKLVINDIIDNNVTFELPTGSRKCNIHMLTIKGKQFKDLRKNGKFQNIDFLKSLFTGNQLALFMYSPKRPPRIKYIYINKELRDKIDKYTNEGKKYC